MKLNRTAILAILSGIVLLAFSSGNAYGITGYSQPDSTSYVGVVVLFDDLGQPIGYGTGFLISQTIMLTAGHNVIGVNDVRVCFDKGPISYSIENGEIVYSTNEAIYTGTMYPYAEYVNSLMTSRNQGNQIFSSSDLGLIVLDKPVSDVFVFPKLPDIGLADSLPVKTELKVVGYGVQYQITPRNSGVINSWTGTLSRNSAQVNLLSGDFAGNAKYLKSSSNPSQEKGGVAFGDSGGPILCHPNTEDQDIVLGVNTYVSNANCAGVTYHARIDTTPVMAWIDGFLRP